MVIGSQRLPAYQIPSFTAVDGTIIQPSQSASNIGVIFDNNLNLERQVAAISKPAIFHIRNLSRIRTFLSVDTTKNFGTCLRNVQIGQL